MKNPVPATSAGRQPRGLVKVNGAQLTGWLSFSVDNNTFYEPDKFTLHLSMSGLPTAMDANWWSSTTSDITVEIFAGFPADPDNYGPSDLTSIFYGIADVPDFEWDDLIIEVTGRDLTSRFIDHKTSAKYINQTSSKIATTLAAEYGLTPVVTATTTLVGIYYQIEQVDLKDDRTEWDLLTWLAREEGFVVYVKGQELHFEPPPSPSQDPYVIQYVPASANGPAQANAQRIKTSRALTVAKDIQVTVRVVNLKAKTALKAVSTRIKGGGGTVQKYSYVRHGLSLDQAQRLADQIRDEISKHEMKLSFDGPADDLLQITDVILLEGTGTAFDQIYFPDSINRSMTFDGGYGWSVSAKNHSPESSPAI
jgi:hypothetical protein